MAAVAAASPGDTIELGAGTYSGPSNCGVAVSKPLKIHGTEGSSNTVIDCRWTARCIAVAGTGVTVSIQGIRLANGACPYLAAKAGSNVRQNSRPMLPRRRRRKRDSSHHHHRVVVATIVLDLDTGTLKVVPNRTKKQERKQQHGQLPKDYDDFRAKSNMTLFDIDLQGGCALVSAGTSASFNDVIFSGGRALMGAGVAVYAASAVEFLSTQFLDNFGNATNTNLFTAGVGLFVWNVTTFSIQESLFSGNMMESDSLSWYALVYDASLTSDSFAYCGGVAIFSIFTAATNIVDVTISNNYALLMRTVSIDGTLSYFLNSGTVSMTRFTVADNTINCVGQGYVSGVVQVEVTNSVSISDLSITGNVGYSGGRVIGWGLTLLTLNSFVHLTNINIQNNFIASARIAAGGALKLSECNAVVTNHLVAINNTIVTQDAGRGGGIVIGNCDNSLFANVIVQANVLISGKSAASDSADTRPYVESSSPKLCSDIVAITNASGSLTDGSGSGNYVSNAFCTWYLSPASALITHVQYTLSIGYLDVEEVSDCSFDSVSIYDGPTTMSPLIGKYCGEYSNSRKIVCGAGLCPDDNAIVTTGSDVTIVFSSDDDANFGGFTISWTTQLQGNIDGSRDIVDVGYLRTQQSGMGGGLFLVVSSNVTLDNWVINQNHVQHSVVAVGGGACISRSSVSMRNVVVTNNTAIALLSAGGGLALFQRSVVYFYNVSTTKNAVSALGECFIAKSAMLCASSWGGGILVLNAALTTTNTTTVVANTASCSGSYCAAQGGGLSVVLNGQAVFNGATIERNSGPRGGALYSTKASNVTMISVRCRNNICNCGSCSWVGGGCCFSDSGTLTIQNSLITNNTVTGVNGGGGGGISIAGSGSATLVNTVLQGNKAPEGGALYGDVSAVLGVYSCVIDSNRADFVGGAVAARGSTALLMKDSFLKNNDALRAADLWGYGEHTFFQLHNMNSFRSNGSIVLILGVVESANRQSVWNCSYPGSVMEEEESANFFSQSCFPCSAGTYNSYSGSSTRPNETCKTCPFGGFCEGASSESNGLKALSGYWGDQDPASGDVLFYICPPAYCCPNTNDTCEYDYCNGFRTGILCGQCPPGMGLRFFSDACGYDVNCTDAGWATAVFLMGAVVASIYLVVTWGGRDTSGIDMVVLYFYQVSGLVKDTPWKHTTPLLFALLQSVFSVSPTGQSGGSGICFTPAMDAIQKIGGQLVFQAVVIVVIAALWVIHGLLHLVHRITFGRHQGVVASFLTHIGPPDKGRYATAFACFLSIAYMSLALAATQMVQCQTVNNKLVWWWDARVACYTSWQIVAFIMLSILIPLPLVLVFFLMRCDPQGPSGRTWQVEVMLTLSAGFSKDRRWWLGFSLIRRLLMVLAYSLVIDAIWKELILGLLCLIFVLANMKAKPFEIPLVQKMETMCLVLLCILALSTTPAMSKLQFKTSSPLKDETVLEWIQFLLVATPILACAIAAIKLNYHEISAAIRSITTRNKRDLTTVHVENEEPKKLCNFCGGLLPEDSTARCHVMC